MVRRIVAKELLDKEVLHKSDVEALIGRRPYEEEKVVSLETEEKTAEQKNSEVSETSETSQTSVTSETTATSSFDASQNPTTT